MRTQLSAQLARRMIRPLLTAALALAFTLSCDAANNPSALVGRWVGVSGNDKDAVMELLGDGTGIVTRYSQWNAGYTQGVAITWKTDKGRFYITVSGVASASAYKLQGSQLTFTEDNGKVSEYVKCNKDCKEAAKEYAAAEKAKATAEKAKAAAALKAKFSKVNVAKGSFTDSRNGKSYKTVKFNNQTWMAENLNYAADGSKCYNNSESNCQKYGRLYNWSAAKKACPSGWHLPSYAEWQTLVDFAGGAEVAGNVLKASNGWDDNDGESGNGIDAFGFSALPGGDGTSSGIFRPVGDTGGWWSSTELPAANALYLVMSYYNAGVYWDRSDVKPGLYSVRCLQD